jgi:4-amino-4-deoxy-L-arabinose transferase-like glycosyltransferase
VAPLPDSGVDAISFERLAWEWAQGGFFEALGDFPGPSSYFISWALAVLYSVTDRSPLMAQSVSLLFGMGTVFMGWLLARKLWGDRAANKAGWVLALFPTLILYSALTMREAYVCFFLLVALYSVTTWAREGGFKPVLLAMFGFVGATFFHGGMVVGALIFLILVFLNALNRSLRAMLHSRLHFLSAILRIMATLAAGLFVSGSFSLPKLGTFETAIDQERLLIITEATTRGSDGEEGAFYPAWTVPDTPLELLYKGFI